MLVAGWSTRVSYAHVKYYMDVVERASTLGWDGLCAMEPGEIRSLVRPLGLTEARVRYLESLQAFIESFGASTDVLQQPNEVLIELIAQNVEGAGYKVAQCAVLYAKGYHCGIVPIDSGMVEMLQPVLPRRLQSGPIGHEVMRAWIERLIEINEHQVLWLAEETGFDLALPSGAGPTWWVHLLLIYHKRFIWNSGQRVGAFRRSKHEIQAEELEPLPTGNWVAGPGAFRRVILEGVDGAGKSTLAGHLETLGHRRLHFPYSHEDNIFERYQRVLATCDGDIVLDRSFLSEIAHGVVRRGHSRLGQDDLRKLLKVCREAGFVFFHVEEPTKILVTRRPDEDPHVLAGLVKEYRVLFDEVREYCPVYYLRPTQLAPHHFLRMLGWLPEEESGGACR